MAPRGLSVLEVGGRRGRQPVLCAPQRFDSVPHCQEREEQEWDQVSASSGKAIFQLHRDLITAKAACCVMHRPPTHCDSKHSSLHYVMFGHHRTFSRNLSFFFLSLELKKCFNFLKNVNMFLFLFKNKNRRFFSCFLFYVLFV
mmetsp:Transcript_19030/g.36837  ORF Transcript_19030/g.36837 Transcript_19030/m.36837 type:complete len:143 (-) Transcript_19030:277-705(-)